MSERRETGANGAKVRRVETMLEELWREVLERGFYGGAAIEVVVADGTIQQIRRRVERTER